MKKFALMLALVGGLSACSNRPEDVDSAVVGVAAAAALALVLITN